MTDLTKDLPREIKPCYGDIRKIVNARRDSAKIPRMVCEGLTVDACFGKQ